MRDCAGTKESGKSGLSECISVDAEISEYI